MATRKYKSNRAVPPREKNVQVRLTEEEHQRLMVYVRDHETSAGKVVRQLLREKELI